MVAPVVIIGGGLAGASAAIGVARSGRPVVVLEREDGPHEKVCGEFLSVEACRDLNRLGLCAEALGGVAIDRVRVHYGRRSAQAALPFVARGLARKVLDEALLDAATRAGAEVRRAVRVTGTSGNAVLTSQGDLPAREILLATGKHDLRGHARPPASSARSYVGFKMHWCLPPAALDDLGSAIELVLLGTGYAGIQRVGDGAANLCLVIRKDALAELGGNWDAMVPLLLAQPRLAALLGDAEPLFDRPLAIANLPYGHIHKPGRDDTLWRLGDQSAMTASLTGDGMAIALRSGLIAAQCMGKGASAAQFHECIGSQTGRQVKRAMRLQRVSELPFAARLGVAAAAAWPGLLGFAARATRLPL